jgi:hypothetical protein
MRSRRFLSVGLDLAALAALAACILSGWLFYEFYLRWVSKFEGGRYFDPETGVVYHDSSFLWGIISLACLLTSAALRLAAWRAEGGEPSTKRAPAG